MRFEASQVAFFAHIGKYKGMSILSGGSGRSETPALVPIFHPFTRAKALGKKISHLPLCRHFTPSLGQSTREQKFSAPALAASPLGQELIFLPLCFALVKE